MKYLQGICQQYARIVNGKPAIKNGACTIDAGRDLHVSIQGRPSRSVFVAEMTFESLDAGGNALNMAEVAVLQEELPEFINKLVKNNLIVGAIHNHWVFTNPTILYVHFQSVEPPFSFVQKFADALNVLKQ